MEINQPTKRELARAFWDTSAPRARTLYLEKVGISLPPVGVHWTFNNLPKSTQRALMKSPNKQ